MKGWLDKFESGGKMQEHQPNFNNSSVSLPEGLVGLGNNTKGRNYSPAWGGQFEDGGTVPKSMRKQYIRHGAPSEGKYAKKTLPSAKEGTALQLTKLNQLTNFTNYNTKQPGGWLSKYE